ncbi:MAG: carbonic anhydrase [Synechococcales bacterium]|nr:carbonic anhydrase [Synechococcales bacterium]
MTLQYGFINNQTMNRRSLLKLGTASLVSAAIVGLWPNNAARAAVSSLEPDEVLRSLLDGNLRFVEHHESHPHQSAKRMQELAQGQHPVATILSCADSRVPAELLFDVGLGDVFNVRVAGNVVNPEVLGSLEYAVGLLNTPLLMVLGHERCGAVTAAVQHQAVPGSIGAFVQDIEPAIALAKIDPSDKPAVAIDKTVIANVHLQIDRLLERSELIRDRQSQGLLKVVGARYDLDSGAVRVV